MKSWIVLKDVRYGGEWICVAEERRKKIKWEKEIVGKVENLIENNRGELCEDEILLGKSEKDL